MDARLDPAKYAGLSEGDAHVIRNAGGRASDDAIRSLVISYKLLGTAEWFVVHHTDCGMEFFTNDVIRGLLSSSLETAQLGADGFTDVGAGAPQPVSTAADTTIRNGAATRTGTSKIGERLKIARSPSPSRYRRRSGPRGRILE